jgi:ABC-type spermidine/putrescine transport system permease subunit I
VADLAEAAATEPKSKRARKNRGPAKDSGVWYPRWYWPSFAGPATLWLLILFLLPLYTVISTAFGTVTIRGPQPVWQPWFWTGQYLTSVLHQAVGYAEPVYIRTFLYVLIASIGCILIGYTVAYFVARYGGKRKGFYLALLIAPFFISYLMRMLAWIDLLYPTGYINSIMAHIPLLPHNVNWLAGNRFTLVVGLIYGYVPYMILPFYGFLDRIEANLLEAGRDLGASPARTFLRVTLPLSRQAILAGIVIVTLPMFGDYYTHDLLAHTTQTNMLGNLLDQNQSELSTGPYAACYVIILMILLLIPMAYYLHSTKKELEAR